MKKLKFHDIYDAIKTSREAISRMDVDLDNSALNTGHGIISDELKAVVDSYKTLYNADMTLAVNLDSVRKQIDVCMKNVNVF